MNLYALHYTLLTVVADRDLKKNSGCAKNSKGGESLKPNSHKIGRGTGGEVN